MSRASVVAPVDGALSRSLGLWRATGVGVGAIVVGGILALAGVAFLATGPGAMVAFALNGLIAGLTALSFAELAAAFPESGGAYAFAKKTLSVGAAFMVGWIVWLASIVAAVLYALGFASYAAFAAARIFERLGEAPPAWLESRAGVLLLAVVATAAYALQLARTASGGGAWATWGKVIVFLFLIAGGIRGGDRPLAFRVPAFPAVPLVGALPVSGWRSSRRSPCQRRASSRCSGCLWA